MSLITRILPPNNKNSKLTFVEMDNNLYYLQSIGVSGVTFSANTLTLINPTGGTKSVIINTGVTFTGGTVSGATSFTNGLSANIISATTYQNLPIDISVTGGTYSAGTATFTNNTGGTFNVTGFLTGVTDTYVTGGTYSNGTATFTNNSGGTFNVSGFYTGDTTLITGATNVGTGITIFDSVVNRSLQINSITGDTLEKITTSLSNNTIQLDVNEQNLTLWDLVVQGNRLLNGNVSYISGLTFNVSPLEYLINGTIYDITSATTVTLNSGDSTYDRIDVIYADINGNTGVLEGTPSENPEKPIVDGFSQVEVTFVLVPANSIIPDINQVIVYNENLGPPNEWTFGSLGLQPTRIIGSSTDQAYTGSTSIRVSGVTGAFTTSFRLTGNTILDTNQYATLQFAIRNLSANTTTSQIRLRFLSTGGTQNGNTVFMNAAGSSGFVQYTSTNTSSWQLISIPLWRFYLTNTNVQVIEFSFNNPNARYYFDLIEFVAGTSSSPPSNSWTTIKGDGTTTITAPNPNATLTISGGTNISSSISGESTVVLNLDNNISLNGVTANTVSATTYQNLPTDVRVTGGTYSNGTITFTNNTGGTFNVTGLVTGTTTTIGGDYLPLSGGTVSGSTQFTNGLTANTISATTYYNVSSNFQYEIHVSQIDGNDTTGDGSLLNPVATITKALTLLNGSRKTIIVHPGGYNENVTVANGNTTIATSELTGANTLLSGTLTIGTLGSGSRISGLKMTNLVISGTAQAYISNCTVDTQVTKSSSGYVEIINSEMQCTSGIQISGSGTTIINGNKNVGVSVSNASAQVIIKGCNSVVTPSASAGNLSIVDCIVTALVGNAITITNSATTLTLINSQVLVTAGNNVAPISVAGIYTIINTIYDKPGSTLTGTNTNSIDYFQFINADKFITQGGTSLQYVMGDGSLSNGFTGGTVTGLTVNGNLNVTGNTNIGESLTANTISANTLNVNGVNITGDTYVTGLTFNTGNYNLTIGRNDGVTFTDSLGILAGDLSVTGGTYDIFTGDATFTNNTGGTFVVSGFLVGYTDLLVTGATYNNNTFTFKNSSGGTFDVSFNTVTGLTSTGTIQSSILSATTYQNLPDNVTGNYLPLSGGTVSGSTNFTNGLTANTISATTYQNLPDNVTGNYLPISGGTVTGSTSFTNGLTANTISATTYQNLPTDVRVTGGTYSAGTITFTNNTGGTFNVTGLVTGTTTTIGGEYLPLSGGTVTGQTIFNQGVTANTISATTYQNLPISGLTEGSYINISGSNGNYTISVTGLTQGLSGEYLSLSGGTVSGGTQFTNGLTANTISATTYQNLPVTADTFVTAFTYTSNTFTIGRNQGLSPLTATIGSVTGLTSTGTISSSSLSATTLTVNGVNITGDTFVTGGTYSAGTITFRNNQNTTFPVTGLTQPFTGGTVTGSTSFTNGLTANTISATTYQNLPVTADTFVTGFTYSNNTFTISRNQGLTPLTSSINVVTGLTVNGNLTVTGTTSSNTISATTYQNLPTDVRVTGGTYSNNTFTYTNNTGGTFNVLFNTVTGLTSTGTISANTISATTYQNLPTDIRVTGSTYSNNTFTSTNNTGGTYSVLFNTVTGLTVNGNLSVTGNTGLGTSSPSTKLQINANNNSSGANNVLRFEDTDTTILSNQMSGKIEFYTSELSGPGVRSYIAGITDSDGDGKIIFGTALGSSTSLTGGTTTGERMRIDENGNVGIGITSPLYSLDVSSGVENTDEIALRVANDNNKGVYFAPTAGVSSFNQNTISGDTVIVGSPGESLVIGSNTGYSGLRFSGGSGALAMTSSGWLGLGSQYIGDPTEQPSQQLDVEGSARFRAVGATAFFANLNITSNGTLTTATSDIRLKENIEPLNNSLEKLLQLTGVTFNWIGQEGKRIGFIAQDVEKVIPELVFTNENTEDKIKGIHMDNITSVLVESIKEQQQQIESLKTEIQDLKNRISNIGG
jgi:hypothetical protein